MPLLRCGGPAAVAAALVPLRGVVANANVALAIVAVVALAGRSGRRGSSVAGAVGGALAFAVLWAPPLGSVRIADGADRLTSIVIVVVGIFLAELARHRSVAAGPLARLRSRRGVEDGTSRGERAGSGSAGRSGRTRASAAGVLRALRRLRLRRRRVEPIESLRSVGRVAQVVAEGDDAEFVLLDVARLLVELLDLDDCRYETPPLAGSSRPTLVHDAELELRKVRWTPMQLGLPERGFDIPVAARGQTLGRFVCVPRRRHTIAEDRVLAALALVDQAASARLIAATT